MSEKHTTDKFVSIDRYYISGLHPHIWKHPEGEMVYFDDYVNLWAENARLKADSQLVVKHLGEACADNLRLKADVNELAEGLKLASEVGIKIADEVTRLKAEVERLRKAGDGMEEVIWLTGCVSGMEIKERAVKAWKQAKEGKV